MDAQEMQKIVDEVVEPWKDADGNLIMILHQIQNRFSYVPREVSFEVAKRLHIPLARIYEVITFYHYFKLKPPGKHVISTCLGTACYLKGAQQLLSSLQDELGIGPGETTPDGEFHVQVVRCLGCCGLSPVLTVGPRVFGSVTPKQIPEIVSEYKFDKASQKN